MVKGSQHDITTMKISETINNFAADCSVSLKFGTDIDDMTPDVLQCSRSSVEGQVHRVKTLSDSQIIALCYEIGGCRI